ncbi:Hypothetical predicted protein, partial [Mytilus galloprovincialis]
KHGTKLMNCDNDLIFDSLNLLRGCYNNSIFKHSFNRLEEVTEKALNGSHYCRQIVPDESNNPLLGCCPRIANQFLTIF